MSQHSKRQVIETISNTGLVPLFYHNDIDVCKSIIKACYEGGARLIEYTST